MPYRLQIEDKDVEAQILARRPQLRVRLGEQSHAVSAQGVAGSAFELTVDGVNYRGWRCPLGDGVQVRLNGRTYLVRLVARGRQAGAALAPDEVRASMPGVVVAVHCGPGQAVKPGDRLLTLESMKLQMTVVASHEATVGQVHVAPEAVFERGALLVSFVREEAREP